MTLSKLYITLLPSYLEFVRLSSHYCSFTHSFSTHLQFPVYWPGSHIYFENTAERFNCAGLPRCWWIGSCDNGPSSEWSIKAATDDFMMVEGSCIRVGPPASESCLCAKSTVIQVHSPFDLTLSLSAIVAPMSAASHWSLAIRDKGLC